jgi:hypothetical protein
MGVQSQIRGGSVKACMAKASMCKKNNKKHNQSAVNNLKEEAFTAINIACNNAERINICALSTPLSQQGKRSTT